MGFLSDLVEWGKRVLSPEYSSYWVIVLSVVAFVESSIFPTQLLFMMPPDVPLLIFAIARPEWALLFGLVCTASSVVGATFAFFVGKKVGRAILRKFLSEERIGVVDKLFAKYGVAAVGIAGFTPVPYVAFTWSAGAFKLDFIPFVLISLVSRGTRFFAEAVLCKVWGEEFKAFFREYFNWVTIAIAVVVVAAVVVVQHFVRRRKKRVRQV
jgi:membrane protein YqaA with SNARE-associated domain